MDIILLVINSEVIEYLKQTGIFLFQVSIGFTVQLILSGKEAYTTWKQKLGKFTLACYAGYLADKICTNVGWDSWRGVIVTLAALLSEGIVKAIFVNVLKMLDDTSYSDILSKFLKKWLNIELDKKIEKKENESKETENK